ncbi:nuclear pore complex protein Nup153-like [Hipposideros larvatus]
MASGAGGIGGGAGGGGGEIPRSRCHRRSTEPYQQGRQRPQGILNRVTESVKIVPQWLQSYFSRNENVCSCSTDRREAAQQLENREDEHVINADEESANIHDGRITLSQQSVIQKTKTWETDLLRTRKHPQHRLDLHLMCPLQKQQKCLALLIFQNQLQVVQEAAGKFRSSF